MNNRSAMRRFTAALMVPVFMIATISGCRPGNTTPGISDISRSEDSMTDSISVDENSDSSTAGSSEPTSVPSDGLSGSGSVIDSGSSSGNVVTDASVDTSKLGADLLSLYNQGYIPKEAISGLDAQKPVTRKALAAVCGKLLGVAPSALPADVPANQWYSTGVAASQQFNLFGSFISTFKFNTSENITRLDAARLAIRLYAAIKGVNDYNVEPGSKQNITDLGGISVEKRWFVYSALSKGFMKISTAGKFNPSQTLTGAEAGVLLKAVQSLLQTEKLAIKAATASQKTSNFKTFPMLKSGLSDTIDTIDIAKLASRGERLAATTLQGLVNRDAPRIFVVQNAEWDWMLDFYKSEGYTDGVGKAFAGNVTDLIKKYKSYIKGAVVFDSAKLFTINIANDIAAVEDRIIIDRNMVAAVKAMGITDITDLTGKFATMYDGIKWTYENCWPFMRRDAIGWTCYYQSTDYNRDYTVQMKIPSVWGPSTGEDSKANETNAFLRDLLSKLPANIPILGFQYSVDGRGNQIGWNEYNGVKICGMYAKYTNVSDWSGNYSIHTRVPVKAADRKFVSKNTTTPSFSKTKKFIAVTMIESGDAPGYIQYGLKPRQWDDARRGQIAYNISYGLANYDLLPGLTQYFFQTSKANDYFFGAISGLGYMYPLEGYGSSDLFDDDGEIISDMEEIVKDYYTKTGVMMDRLGFTSMGVYSHPGAFWAARDYTIVSTMIAPYLPHLTSIFADMGRVVNLTGKETTAVINGKIPLFHSISFWPSASLGNSYETANDTAAANFLADEIENNVNSGNFFHAMAYSWMYSARRIELAKLELDRRHPGVYEFVSIDQLERLYKANK